jgi:hypothetical protein
LGIDERPTSNVPNATGADGLPKNLPFRRLGVLGLALLLAGAEAGVEARWLSGAAAGAALRRGVEDMEMGMWSWNAAMDWTEVSFPGRAKRSAPKNRRGARIPVKNTARAASTGSKTPWGHTGHKGHKVQTMRAVSGQVEYTSLQIPVPSNWAPSSSQAYRACSAPQCAIKVKGPKPSLFICRLGALGNLRLSATASSDYFLDLVIAV